MMKTLSLKNLGKRALVRIKWVLSIVSGVFTTGFIIALES